VVARLLAAALLTLLTIPAVAAAADVSVMSTS
jgi:hypothetical protein